MTVVGEGPHDPKADSGLAGEPLTVRIGQESLQGVDLGCCDGVTGVGEDGELSVSEMSVRRDASSTEQKWSRSPTSTSVGS